MLKRFSFSGRDSYLNPDKLALIDYVYQLGARSFADLGALWGVHGGYAFYAASREGARRVVVVDTHPTDSFMENKKQFGSTIEFIRGSFGDRAVEAKVGAVDAIFLFDVLLHQVKPDWHEILDLYAPSCRHFVIYNQQFTASEKTVRLLDFGEEEYFRNVPHSPAEEPYVSLFEKLEQKHPDYETRIWKDVHHIWQWGITDRDLIAKCNLLGFRTMLYKNCGRFGSLQNFENHAFVFSAARVHR